MIPATTGLRLEKPAHAGVTVDRTDAARAEEPH
jgi:hypothetical protein